MHGLKMPDAFARIGVQTDQRFCEQSVTLAGTAVVIVAWRTERDVQESALLIQGHRRPSVGMAGVGFSAAFPSIVSEFALLRNWIEFPYTFAGMDVEGLNVAWRIFFVNETVRDTVSKDHEILVNQRRGGIRVVELINRPQQILR